jgi:hypothetical protein
MRTQNVKNVGSAGVLKDDFSQKYALASRGPTQHQECSITLIFGYVLAT